ncbi:MAG TPA: hypothetical protein VN989_14685, partial [Casimicrobiaceae bacterium]|nr:hypothetical protein [Casimicrobiaceae bacterium]
PFWPRSEPPHSREDTVMTRFTSRMAAVALAVALGSTLALAAPTALDVKKAECAREAKTMHFGIHFLKRARFMKNCMARQ